MRYGGFWRRFGAAIIDGILLVVVNTLIALLLDRNTASLISAVIGWVYYAGMESSSRQATIGKSLLGIYVTDIAGNRISFLRATGRYFAKILSAITLFIGYIMAAFTERKQGLHDMIASTLVLSR